MSTVTESPPPDPAAPIFERRHTELLDHRETGLLRLGFSIEQIEQLKHRPDVVHDAEALLERHWPHEWIVEKLT